MAGDLKRIIGSVKVQIDSQFEFGVVPGSATYRDGKKGRVVKAADNGDVYTADNLEEAKGMIKFEFYSTLENLNDCRQIEERENVTVKIFNDKGFERVMKSGVSLNDSEKSVGSDGKGEFTFEGSPLE